MSMLNNIKNIKFRSLPPRVGEQARQKRLLVKAQSDYLKSRAPGISNKAYWEAFPFQSSYKPFSYYNWEIANKQMVRHLNVFLKDVRDPVRSIIEYGCGVGRAAGVLKGRGFWNYTGIDLVETAVQLAKEKVPGMEFKVGSILSHSPAKIYDGAIVIDVLLWLSPEEQIKSLVNINKSLSMGAPLFIRWAAGNDSIVCNKRNNGKEEIEEWLFLATREYIKQTLKICGFSLIRPIQPDIVPYRPWAMSFGYRDIIYKNWWLVFAKKDSQLNISSE